MSSTRYIATQQLSKKTVIVMKILVAHTNNQPTTSDKGKRKGEKREEGRREGERRKGKSW